MATRTQQRSTPQGQGPTLFQAAERTRSWAQADTPLAERMRPSDLEEMAGQSHLISASRPLAKAIAGDRIPSMILWGPPGSGKTTLARIVAKRTKATVVPYSAVLGSLPELRGMLADARKARAYEGRRTILFIDEIHRFNKGQQDAFLPDVENGTVTLIGATTENPSFSVNAALLSRCKVFRLEALEPEALAQLLARSLADAEHGLGATGISAEPRVLEAIARLSEGDARRALNSLEMMVGELAREGSGGPLTIDDVSRMAERAPLLYDKTGDEHHNVISALIKSMRGSDPDAAIYWAMRMLEAGDDPLFVLRRLMIFASEDVGNADPRALQVATSADEAFRRMGMPEGLYPIAQAVLYLAVAPKSNAVGVAFKAAQEAVREHGSLAVPLKLRNAPTRLMREQGYGEGYRYAHNEADHFAAGETYLPDELAGTKFYAPSGQGLEKVIAERLDVLRKRSE